MFYDPLHSERQLVWTVRVLFLVIAIGGALTFWMFLSSREGTKEHGTSKIGTKDPLTFLGFGGIL